MKRLAIWLSVVTLLGVAGFFGWRYRKAHAPPAYTFQTEPVTRHDIVGKITATGTLLATVTVTVGTQVSGRVQKILVDFNSPVKKGQLIAKIDPLLFEAALEQSRANYLQATAQLESAKAQALLNQKLYARELALQKDNLAAQQDVDSAETAAAVAVANVAVAKASLAQAQASLHQAETNLDYTNIVSPIDGTVISRSVDVGQTVAASLSTPTLFTIAQDLTRMQVNTNVSEGDVGRLQEKMDAYFTVDAFPGRRFKGRISQIRNAATTTQNVVTYDAVIDVDNSDLKLRPGMTASSTVIYDEKRDVLGVPNTALRFHPPPEIADPVPSSDGRAHAHGSRGHGNHGAVDGGAERPRGDWKERHGGGSASGSGAGSGTGSAATDATGSEEARANKDRKVLWVVNGDRLSPVMVHTGLTDGTVTEVLGDALPEGSAVVVDVSSASKASEHVFGGGGGGGGGAGGGGGGGGAGAGGRRPMF
jgi:HlyD family secretion protein